MASVLIFFQLDFSISVRQGKEKIQLSFEDAIQCIQKNERARQGRLRAKFMKEIRQQEEREKRAETKGFPTIDPDVAATKIQKVLNGIHSACA